MNAEKEEPLEDNIIIKNEFLEEVNMMNEATTRSFIEFCENELNLHEKTCAYTYQSLSVCVIDCVYSLRAQYDSTAKKVVARYAEKYLKGDVNSSSDQLEDLIRHIEEAGGPDLFARDVLNNQQKSGGVLKSEVCLNLARYLRYLRIDNMADFRNFESPELLEIVIHAVKGMGDAGTNYLFMLAGDPNRCKPDTQIHQCVRDACGKDLNNKEIQILFKNAVKELSAKYPALTVSMLDGIIWRKYQIANKKFM